MTAESHLAQYNVTIAQAYDFIFTHIDTPEVIFQACQDFAVTNQMLSEIVGVEVSTVESFWSGRGFNYGLLSGAPAAIRTSTVDENGSPHINIYDLRDTDDGAFSNARSYGDLNNDGYIDIFIAPGIYLSQDGIQYEIYLNNGNGEFHLDNTYFSDIGSGGLHPRKSVITDFNSDGLNDVVIADHGYDAAPYPGAAPVILLSSDQGLVKAAGLDDYIGFLHSVTVGDIDQDGDQDAFFTDSQNKSFFLINDGLGGMTYDTSLTPEETFYTNYFTSELVDVDQDGYLDLIMAGHEFEGVDSVIYWGSDTPGFSAELKSIIPAGPSGHQIIVDIDVADFDGDGVNELILNRVGSPPDLGFYGSGGAYLQYIDLNGRAATDLTLSAINNDTFSSLGFAWVEWVRIADIDTDGDLDLFVDDSHYYDENLVAYNDGTGQFTFDDGLF